MKSVILALLFVLPLASQADDGVARAAIEALYTRVDAAMARQDSGEIARLVLPDAWIGSGDFHIPLLAWLSGAMNQPGRTSRSIVTEARLSEETAVATVQVHIAS